VQALVVQADGIFFQSRAALVEALAAQKLPALFTQVQNVEAGGLMSYGPDIAASYRRGAYYVDRLLKGAQAAELPIEAPSKIELAVNLKAAAGLGLALPPALLKQANRLIK
jgi:putative tryptophan/tyrosine transport system substrate-binding protein